MQQNTSRAARRRPAALPRIDGLAGGGLALGLFLAALALWLELDAPAPGTGLLVFTPAVVLAASLCPWPAASAVALLAEAAVLRLCAGTPDIAAVALFAVAAGLVTALGAAHWREAAALAAAHAGSAEEAAALRLRLHEQQHRAANTLQLAAAAVAIEGRRGTDAATRAALAAAARRLELLAKLNRRLEADRDQGTRDAGALLRAVAHDLLEAVDAHGVSCAVEVQPLPVGERAAVPLALALVELLTNALKHAFPDGRPGIVTVRLQPDGPDRAVLEVRDNGPAPAPFAETATGTLGLSILRGLAAQLGGELRYRREGGTVATLAFPLMATEMATPA